MSVDDSLMMLSQGSILSTLNENSITNKLIENNLLRNVVNEKLPNGGRKSHLNNIKKYVSENDNNDDDDDDELLHLIEINTQLKRNKLIDDWQMNPTPPSTQFLKAYAKNDTFYELPLEVGNIFKKLRKIDKLYDWQDECLKLECLNVANSSNLLYLAPTSGN